MKATDLIIGDWVYNRVADITFQVYPQFFSQWHNKPEQFEDIIQPISLTAEILEKNDFELYGNEWQYHTEDDKGHVLIEFSKDNKLSINIYNSLALKDDKGRADLVHFGRDWCDSFYVHDLQNVFRLCGIEKEIKI